VETGKGAVYAYLRTAGSDHVLVVVNLGPSAIPNPTLDLLEGPLTGVTGARPVLGPEVAAPEVTADGGLSGYRPLAELDPYEVLVVQLTTGG
jgi:hypothetical protein